MMQPTETKQPLSAQQHDDYNRKSGAFQPYQPPTGKFSSGLCECLTNLWPSCCGVFLGGYFGGCIPLWLAGQISTRIGWFTTKEVILTYVSLYALMVAIAIFVYFLTVSHISWIFFYIPIWCAFFFLIALRIKFVEKYQIQESLIAACCTAFWCNPCSLCQMARHQYGYRYLFDGDAILDGSQRYDLVPGAETSQPTTTAVSGVSRGSNMV